MVKIKKEVIFSEAGKRKAVQAYLFYLLFFISLKNLLAGKGRNEDLK